jgi:hypothetical protein
MTFFFRVKIFFFFSEVDAQHKQHTSAALASVGVLHMQTDMGELVLQMQQHFGEAQSIVKRQLVVVVDAVHVQAVLTVLWPRLDAHGDGVKQKGFVKACLHGFRSEKQLTRAAQWLTLGGVDW